MAAGPITSCQIKRGKVETMTDFIFLGSKITMDSDCSHQIKRHLFLARIAMTNLNSILKSRDVTLPTKSIKSKLFFPVVMYGYESLAIKKAECWRIDIFKLRCWRRLLRVPWIARKSVNPTGNQLWVVIGRTGAKIEALILWSPVMKNWLIRKELHAGKDWGQEEKGRTEDKMVGWHHWLNRNEFAQTPADSVRQGRVS